MVGTTLGHPEMIWATFEHVNNAPNLKYTYQTAGGQTITRDKDGPGEWLFSNFGAMEPDGANELVSKAKMDEGDIVAVEGQTIGPVNVTRRFPWGSLETTANPATAHNTKIIAINKSVLGQLADERCSQEVLAGRRNLDHRNKAGSKRYKQSARHTGRRQRDNGDIQPDQKLFRFRLPPR